MIKARDRLNAMQMLKRFLLGLERLQSKPIGNSNSGPDMAMTRTRRHHRGTDGRRFVSSTADAAPMR
jgi:hypothetical protein